MKLFGFIKANKGMTAVIGAIGAVAGVAFSATLRKLPFVNKLPNK